MYVLIRAVKYMIVQEQVMSLLFLCLYIGINVLNLTDVLAKKRPQREIYLKEVLT